MAAAIEGVLILVGSRGHRLRGGAPPDRGHAASQRLGVGIAVLAVSIVVNFVVSRTLSRRAAATSSPALAADAAHLTHRHAELGRRARRRWPSWPSPAGTGSIPVVALVVAARRRRRRACASSRAPRACSSTRRCPTRARRDPRRGRRASPSAGSSASTSCAAARPARGATSTCTCSSARARRSRRPTAPPTAPGRDPRAPRAGRRAHPPRARGPRAPGPGGHHGRAAARPAQSRLIAADAPTTRKTAA